MPQPEPSGRAGSRVNPGDAAPASLRWAVWLLALEAAGLLVVIVLLIVAELRSPTPNGLAVIAYATVMAAVLAGLSLALRRRQARARGPAIVLQLLLLPIGYYMVTGGLVILGVPVMIIGVAGAATLIAPATRTSLGPR